MSNPVLSEGAFTRASRISSAEQMTTNGAIMKTFILGFVFSIVAIVAYSYFKANAMTGNISATATIIIPAILAFVIGLVISFKPNTSPYLSVIYTILEAVVVAAISFAFNSIYDGIVLEAVVCTMAAFFSMLVLFRAGVIKATEKFRAVITTAITAIAVFYIVMFVISFFGIRPDWFYGSSAISIGISVVIVVVAALSLILDFDFIANGENAGLPKYMEWYAAFGLMVTIIWLYLEILRLLAKLKDR